MTTTPSKNCSRCGSEISAETAGGLCPKCLLAMNIESRTMPEDEGKPPVAPPSPEEIREKFPQFEILEYLGRGGMGAVYKARQKALDRIVAIKILADEWMGSPGFAERFEREAKLLAQMSHPNIVTVHDFGEAGGLFYLAMEYVDGVNVRDLLGDGKLAAEQALAIVPPICEALQYAHSKGVVHRDIKPENLLLDRDGRVKIADFGIAAMAGASGDRSGTPPYMAPEQQAGTSDERADIYALGVVLYEMLTGERPATDLVPPSQKVELDVRIDEMVLRALEKEPERRYQTVEEFRTMVDTITWNPPAGRETLKPTTSWGRKVAKVAAIVCGLILLGLVGAAGLYFMLGGQLENPSTLAHSPEALRRASNAQVIAAGLAEPDEPWPWQELERRGISETEAERIIDGLTKQISKNSPSGLPHPIPWMNLIIDYIGSEGLVDEHRAIEFVKAVHGDIRPDPLPRLRTGARSLILTGDWRYVWDNSLMGLTLMNQVVEVRIDRQPVALAASNSWDNASFTANVPLPELEPGTHMLELVVHSALVKDEDLLGLPRNAPAADWPPSVESWERTVTATFQIHGPNAPLVGLIEDPALDPVTHGGLSIDEIVVHSDGSGVALVIAFQADDLQVPVAFDVTLRTGGREIRCGSFWVAPDPAGGGGASSNTEMRVNLENLDPAWHKATLVLVPRPEAIEHVASVDRIWGGEVVFPDVPMKRLDLRGSIASGSDKLDPVKVSELLTLNAAFQEAHSLADENAFLYDKRIEQARAAGEILTGRPVFIPAEVRRVEKDNVTLMFFPAFEGEGNVLLPQLRLVAEPGEEVEFYASSSSVPHLGGTRLGGRAIGEMAIGRFLPEDFAMRLTSGDHLLLSGEIQEIQAAPAIVGYSDGTPAQPIIRHVAGVEIAADPLEAGSAAEARDYEGTWLWEETDPIGDEVRLTLERPGMAEMRGRDHGKEFERRGTWSVADDGAVRLHMSGETMLGRLIQEGVLNFRDPDASGEKPVIMRRLRRGD